MKTIIDFYNFNINESLKKGKEIYNNNDIDKPIEFFMQLDPTKDSKGSPYKYLEFIISWYNQGVDIDTIKNYINALHTNKKVSKYINLKDPIYLNFKSILKHYRELRPVLYKSHLNTFNNSTIKYEEFEIHFPLSFIDSKRYGKDTSWCISQFEMWYNTYIINGPLVYVKVYDLEPTEDVKTVVKASKGQMIKVDDNYTNYMMAFQLERDTNTLASYTGYGNNTNSINYNCKNNEDIYNDLYSKNCIHMNKELFIKILDAIIKHSKVFFKSDVYLKSKLNDKNRVYKKLYLMYNESNKNIYSNIIDLFVDLDVLHIKNYTKIRKYVEKFLKFNTNNKIAFEFFADYMNTLVTSNTKKSINSLFIQYMKNDNTQSIQQYLKRNLLSRSCNLQDIFCVYFHISTYIDLLPTLIRSINMSNFTNDSFFQINQNFAANDQRHLYNIIKSLSNCATGHYPHIIDKYNNNAANLVLNAILKNDTFNISVYDILNALRFIYKNKNEEYMLINDNITTIANYINTKLENYKNIFKHLNIPHISKYYEKDNYKQLHSKLIQHINFN